MKRSMVAVFLVFLIFFVISLLTNILNSLIPNIIDDFSLTQFVASLVTFSFFIAYGVMSIPAGVLLERYRERKVLVASFVGGPFRPSGPGARPRRACFAIAVRSPWTADRAHGPCSP